jgi:hypothetical protein
MAGRGRLSSIDLLPDEALPDVQWAIEELKARRRTADSIRDELNQRLLSIPGCKPISKSSFGRYSLHLAAHGAAMMQLRDAAAMFAERMDEEPDGDVGLLLVETIKSLVYSVMMAEQDKETPDMKMLKAAADAVYSLEIARRTNLKAAHVKREKFITQAADEVEKAAKEAGLSADRAAQLRREVLGVRPAG